jgi:hypothetical protein
MPKKMPPKGKPNPFAKGDLVAPPFPPKKKGK